MRRLKAIASGKLWPPRAELALLYVPNLPRQVGVITIVLALVGAFKFTSWYPQRGGSAQKS